MENEEEVNADATANEITLGFKNKNIISLRRNGDIFVKDKLIENDYEVYTGMKEFLEHSFHFAETMKELKKRTTNLEIDEKKFESMETRRTKQRKEAMEFFKQYNDTVQKSVNEIERKKNKDPKRVEEVTKSLRELGMGLMEILSQY